MKLKEVTMEEAITSPALWLGKCYMLVEIENETTILELQRAAGFYLDTEEEIIDDDDFNERIESFKKKAESLKARLEALEIRDKAIMDTSSMIDETIKNSLIEADYFPEFEEELSEELTEEPEPERTTEEPEPVEKETKEDKKKETKTKYDIPKVQALLNAGWSNQQLAVEFGVTKEQMSKNLYNWRKSGKIK